RERADVQLIDDELVPLAAAPTLVVPVIARWIDDFARRVHAFRVEARRRIRHVDLIIDSVAIPRTRTGILDGRFEPALAERAQRPLLPRLRLGPQHLHCNFARARCPQTKARTTGLDLRTERHRVRANHRPSSAGSGYSNKASARP